MDRQPPLAVSPRRLRTRPRPRPHRAPRPPLVPSSSVQTPPGSKKATSMRPSVCAIPSPVRHQPSPTRASVSALPSPLRLDTTSSMLRASVSALPPRATLDLPAAAPSAKAAGKENIPAALLLARPARTLEIAALARAASPVAGPLFVQGRLYDLYSARRDARLKRNHGSPYGGEQRRIYQ